MKIEIDKFFRGVLKSQFLMAMNKNGREKYASKISKEMGVSPFNGLKIISGLAELGLIERTKKGRKVILTLTDKGKEAAVKLSELKEVLERE